MTLDVVIEDSYTDRTRACWQH